MGEANCPVGLQRRAGSQQAGVGRRCFGRAHVARGPACVVRDENDGLDRLQPGDVLVAVTTTPGYNTVLPIVVAVATVVAARYPNTRASFTRVVSWLMREKGQLAAEAGGRVFSEPTGIPHFEEMVVAALGRYGDLHEGTLTNHVRAALSAGASPLVLLPWLASWLGARSRFSVRRTPIWPVTAPLKVEVSYPGGKLERDAVLTADLAVQARW